MNFTDLQEASDWIIISPKIQINLLNLGYSDFWQDSVANQALKALSTPKYYWRHL